jgi:Protein of unknown function (DUF1018).
VNKIKGYQNNKTALNITGPQMRAIWATSKKIGLDAEQLHALVLEVTGKESLKALLKGEAGEVIDVLFKMGGKTKKPFPVAENVVELVTKRQLFCIGLYEKELGWKDNPERLKGFIKRIIKRERIRTKQEGIKVIQGLKGMKNLKLKKEVRDVR